MLGYFVHKVDAQRHDGWTQLLKTQEFFCVFSIAAPNFRLSESLMYPKPNCWTYTAEKQLSLLAPGKSQ